jgi:hypothetical protein
MMEGLGLAAFGASGKKKGGFGRRVILNANGQVVAHVFGRVIMVNKNFRLAPGTKVPGLLGMSGGGNDEASLF